MELKLVGTDLQINFESSEERLKAFEILGFPCTSEFILSNPMVHVHISYTKKKIYICEKYDPFRGRTVYRTRIFTDTRDGKSSQTHIPILAVRHMMDKGINLDRMLPETQRHSREIIPRRLAIELNIL